MIHKRILLFSLMFILSLMTLSSQGESRTDVLVWQGNFFIGSTIQNGSFEFNFTIFDAAAGGDVYYTNLTNLTTGFFGEWRTEQHGVSALLNDSAKDFFLEIRIDNDIQPPRRRITLFNFLRADVNDTMTQNFTIDGVLDVGGTNSTFINIVSFLSDIYILGQLVCLADTTNCPAGFTDTNETLRFNNLTVFDCPSGQVVQGVHTNGTVACVADANSGNTNFFDQNLNKTDNATFINVTVTGFFGGNGTFINSIDCSNIVGADADFCVDANDGGGNHDGNVSSICADGEVLLGEDTTTCINLNLDRRNFFLHKLQYHYHELLVQLDVEDNQKQ